MHRRSQRNSLCRRSVSMRQTWCCARSQQHRMRPKQLSSDSSALCVAAEDFGRECQIMEPGGDVELSLCVSSEDNERVTLEMLPAELLSRIFYLAAGAASGEQKDVTRSGRNSVAFGRAAGGAVANAACTCRAFYDASALCWRELCIRGLFDVTALPSAPVPPWLSFSPPYDWRRCLARTQPAMLPWRLQWSMLHGGSGGLATAAWATACSVDDSTTSSANRGSSDHAAGAPVSSGAFLPRRTFAHSSCMHAGKLYVFGGRHESSHSNSLDVLDLTSRPMHWVSSPPTSGTPPTARRQHSECGLGWSDDGSGRWLPQARWEARLSCGRARSLPGFAHVGGATAAA